MYVESTLTYLSAWNTKWNKSSRTTRGKFKLWKPQIVHRWGRQWLNTKRQLIWNKIQQALSFLYMTTSQGTPFQTLLKSFFSLLSNHRNNEKLSTHHQRPLRLSCPVARLPSDFDPDCAWQFRVRWSWWSRRHLCQITRRPL